MQLAHLLLQRSALAAGLRGKRLACRAHVRSATQRPRGCARSTLQAQLHTPPAATKVEERADASGVPAGSIGASTPLPPEADSAAARRSWGKNVREVGSDAELREALLEAGPQTVVVDFSAAWCEKCKAVEPVVANLGEQHPEMRFVIADADFLPEMAADIRYTPTFAFYQRGKRVDEFVGTNERMLRDRVWLHSTQR